jgi:ABC-2 type transport system ATP-binding protein
MSAEGRPAIEVRGLAKHFSDVRAVAGVHFDVLEGELFGFLGPNGAGKTTTVRMLTGVLDPTAGTARIQGHDIRTEGLLSRAHLGVVPEQANVYPDLSVWRNIMLMAELHGVPRRRRIDEADRLLEALGLTDRKKQKARSLSKGLRQRLMLCTALVTRPDVLFLDEPTGGLDVQSTRVIRNIVVDLNRQGVTVFLTTHNMAEAGELCSRIAIINDGSLVAIDTPERLRRAVRSSRYLEVRFAGDGPPVPELEALEDVSHVEAGEGAVRLYGERPGRVAADVACLARAKDIEIEHLCTRKPSLEDVFLSFTDPEGREPQK